MLSTNFSVFAYPIEALLLTLDSTARSKKTVGGTLLSGSRKNTKPNYLTMFATRRNEYREIAPKFDQYSTYLILPGPCDL